MSALDRSQALNALNLKPSLPAVTATSARSQDKAPEGKEETSKDRFSRLLAQSRSEASQKPADTPDRAAKSAPSSTRPSRAAAKNGDDKADNAADDVERSRPMSAPSRSGTAARGASVRDAHDPAPGDDTVVGDPATTDKAATDTAPGPAGGNPDGLPPWLLGLPPAPTAAPAAAAGATAAPGDVTGDSNPATQVLTALGKAGPGLAGLEPAGTATAGSKGSGADTAPPVASAPERWLGHAALTPGATDAKAALDASAVPVTPPQTALASLAAWTVGAGQRDESPKTGAALDAVPLTSSAAIAGHGVASLVRSIDPPAPASATVPTPVGDPGFQEALATQVSVFARGGLSKAELHLNPAELGPVSVQITMNGDQARVDFGADRAQTRQAIEAGWATLAASLQDAGFTLSGGGVSQQAHQQAAERQATPQSTRTDRAPAVDDVPATSIVAARPRAGSALDLYA